MRSTVFARPIPFPTAHAPGTPRPWSRTSSTSEAPSRRARRSIVVVAVESDAEFSNLYYTRVVDAVRQSGATLHFIGIGTPSASTNDEMRNRNMTIAEATSLTGGRRDQVLAESGLSERLVQLADELLNQYVVTYSRPEQLIPPERLEVTVTRPGVTVRAPKRLPGTR